MLIIGKIQKHHSHGQARICAEITLNGRSTTLWFGVSEAQEAYLCDQRSDAFILALLPTAMRGGYDISCDTPMSQRLHYQLEQYLIPTLCSAGERYHPVSIHAPLTSERLQNNGGVGTGFSGGVDSLYTIMTHGADSPFPLTHLALFNVGVFEGPGFREGFRKSCSSAECFAKAMGLELVGLDSNLSQVLPERFLDVYSFRNLAGAMALQNLFSVYLLSSGHDIAHFSIDLHNSATYDMLTVNCAQTESLTFYLSGGQTLRSGKLKELSAWEPAHRWLHPCVYGHVGEVNCGHCKKCARDMTTLYALGTLDEFSEVFDIPAYKKVLPQRIGFVLTNRGNHSYDETIELLERNCVEIPPAAYACERQFRIAMKNLKEKHV